MLRALVCMFMHYIESDMKLFRAQRGSLFKTLPLVFSSNEPDELTEVKANTL